MTSKIAGLAPVRSVSPEEYVGFCLSPGKRPDLKGCDLKVVGSVDLRDGQDGVRVHTLRKAVIEGGIFADETCALTTIEDCVVEGRCILDKSRLSHVKRKFHAKGDFSAKECKRLQFLGGQYDGELNLEDADISRLEKGLVCKGKLCLTRCRVQRLNCQVEGGVSISDSGVREFGPDFRVGGDLRISDCKCLHKLGYVGSPNNVKIYGWGLKRISGEFRCRGELDISSNHSLESISPEVKIGGLDLWEVGLEELDLPNIDGDAKLGKCEDLKRLTLGGKGEVTVLRCMIANIDHVGNDAKSVKFENCLLVREAGGKWKGNVTFDDMRSLEIIKPSFECGGDFRAWSCHSLQKIGGSVKGNALVSCCDSIKGLDGDLSIGGNLHVAACGFENVTLGCHVGGDLKVFATAVSFTSDSFHISGNADLGGAEKLKYMRGFVGGNLDVDGSGIVSLEPDLEVGGDISAKGCHSLSKIDCEVGGEIRATGKRVYRASGKAVSKIAGRGAEGKRDDKVLPKGKTSISNGVAEEKDYRMR